ncbi:hypothetical protein B5S28_g1292 [[Candida] boidinii]|nr:hypothetical protein B5S28_g1292 [[Candida] boidinii]OWB60751.1 hypothetical protein B5S29_g1632 [[Candida] boidinii]
MSGATEVLTRGHLLADYNHATDATYKQYREAADRAYQRRSDLSKKSQQAFKSGDKAKAHELSVDAKKQLDIAEENNAKAAEYVFYQNNLDSDNNEIDLHGLYVKEAEYILKKRVVMGIQNNESTLEVIVGKGLHSQNGIAKLKPAVENLCREANLRNYIDHKNTGVLVIELQNANVPQSWMNYSSPYNAPTKPNNTYNNQPGYQQQPQYNNNYQQQQPQYNNNYQQQQQYNNNNNNNNNNDIIVTVLKMICACLSK